MIDCVSNRSRPEVGVLVEGGDLDVSAPTDRTRLGFSVSDQHVDERRLSGAVQTNETDAITGGDRDRYVAEEISPGAGHRQIGCVDKNHELRLVSKSTSQFRAQ